MRNTSVPFRPHLPACALVAFAGYYAIVVIWLQRVCHCQDSEGFVVYSSHDHCMVCDWAHSHKLVCVSNLGNTRAVEPSSDKYTKSTAYDTQKKWKRSPRSLERSPQRVVLAMERRKAIAVLRKFWNPYCWGKVENCGCADLKREAYREIRWILKFPLLVFLAPLFLMAKLDSHWMLSDIYL